MIKSMGCARITKANIIRYLVLTASWAIHTNPYLNKYSSISRVHLDLENVQIFQMAAHINKGQMIWLTGVAPRNGGR